MQILIVVELKLFIELVHEKLPWSTIKKVKNAKLLEKKIVKKK